MKYTLPRPEASPGHYILYPVSAQYNVLAEKRESERDAFEKSLEPSWSIFLVTIFLPQNCNTGQISVVHLRSGLVWGAQINRFPLEMELGVVSLQNLVRELSGLWVFSSQSNAPSK